MERTSVHDYRRSGELSQRGAAGYDAPMSTAPRVFISHATADRPFVESELLPLLGVAGSGSPVRRLATCSGTSRRSTGRGNANGPRWGERAGTLPEPEGAQYDNPGQRPGGPLGVLVSRVGPAVESRRAPPSGARDGSHASTPGGAPPCLDPVRCSPA